MRYAVVIRDVDGNEIVPRLRFWTRGRAVAEAKDLNARGKASAFMVKETLKTQAERLADQMWVATVERERVEALAGARGIVYGVLFGLVFWTLLAIAWALAR